MTFCLSFYVMCSKKDVARCSHPCTPLSLLPLGSPSYTLHWAGGACGRCLSKPDTRTLILLHCFGFCVSVDLFPLSIPPFTFLFSGWMGCSPDAVLKLCKIYWQHFPQRSTAPMLFQVCKGYNSIFAIYFSKNCHRLRENALYTVLMQPMQAARKGRLENPWNWKLFWSRRRNSMSKMLSAQSQFLKLQSAFLYSPYILHAQR